MAEYKELFKILNSMIGEAIRVGDTNFNTEYVNDNFFDFLRIENKGNFGNLETYFSKDSRKKLKSFLVDQNSFEAEFVVESIGERFINAKYQKKILADGFIVLSIIKMSSSEKVEEKILKEKPKLELHMYKYKEIVETMNEGVWVSDEKGKTVYANKKFLDMVEYDLEEVMGWVSYKFWTPESIEVLKENIKKRVTGEKSSYEGVLLSKNGKHVPVVGSGTPLPGGGFAGIWTDMREIKAIQKAKDELQKQLEKNMKLQSELSRQIDALNNSAIVVETDQNFNVTFVNEFFETISGYKSKELLGKKFILIDENLNKPELIQQFKKEINKNNIRKGDIKREAKEGYYYRVQTVVTPFLTKQGGVYKYVIISYDISQIQQLSEMKDDFINISTHELRTPLTVIKGYVSMMIDGDLGTFSEDEIVYANRILTSVERLIGLVNDMLDLSKLESGKMTFNDENIFIKDLFDDLYYEFNMLADQKGIKFDVKIDPEYIDYKIKVDMNRIKQVLINMIGNALKFTPEGGKVILNGNFQEKNKLVFEVIDNGVGIPKDQLKSVFEKFKQADNPFQKKTKGTGLGLSISQEILKHYGTKMSVRSELGKGSTFFFELDYFK